MHVLHTPLAFLRRARFRCVVPAIRGAHAQTHRLGSSTTFKVGSVPGLTQGNLHLSNTERGSHDALTKRLFRQRSSTRKYWNDRCWAQQRWPEHFGFSCAAMGGKRYFKRTLAVGVSWVVTVLGRGSSRER